MGFKDKSISIASYDALGRRIVSKGDDETVLIWWGDSECAEYEHRASQDAIQNDIMGHPTRLNSVIARDTEDRENRVELQWYHKNYLDHVYAVSDDNGNLVEHYRYTAFGEPEIYSTTGARRNTSAIGNTVMWNTRRYDADNGLYYYKYRHYAANIGRWLGRDPIMELGGENLYAFALNKVLVYFDKLGLEPEKFKPDLGDHNKDKSNASKKGNCASFPFREKLFPVDPKEFLKRGCKIVKAGTVCEEPTPRKLIAYLAVDNNGKLLSGHVIAQECGKDTYEHQAGDFGPVFDKIKDPSKAADAYFDDLKKNGKLPNFKGLLPLHFCCPCVEKEEK